MLRLFIAFIIILFFIIIYYIIKTLFRANQKLRNGNKRPQHQQNKYKDIEEADFREIESGSNKKNDKDVQE
jgi:uncharacterized membrane protein